MFPLFPRQIPEDLTEMAFRVQERDSHLGDALSPLLREDLSRFLLLVNSYYTNAMEGNPSKLKDIEDAVAGNFSRDPVSRNHQLEHKAHITAHEMMRKKLAGEEIRITSLDFICWLHAEFYKGLPPEMQIARTVAGKTVPMVPGEIREAGLSVGRHDAPEHEPEILDFMRRFDEGFNPANLRGVHKLLAMAASHHRLLWIHPFPDGNGRVARLFSDAYAEKIGLRGASLWSVSRGFARTRQGYDSALAMADLARRNDLDGRGPLSEETLVEFCRYYLRSCLDQIGYMGETLRLGKFREGFKEYLLIRSSRKEIGENERRVLLTIVEEGAVPRGSVRKICRVAQRQASNIIRRLSDQDLVYSRTPYGDLRLKFTSEMAVHVFPGLA